MDKETTELTKLKEALLKMKNIIKEMDEALDGCDNSSAKELYKNGYDALRYNILMT